jgi:hypothetical protein
MLKKILRRELLQKFNNVSQLQRVSSFNAYDKSYIIESTIVKNEILLWFNGLFNSSYEPSIGDFEIDLNPHESGSVINAYISFFTSEFHADWHEYLHGAKAFESYVNEVENGDLLMKRIIKLLGYSKKDWSIEERKSPVDLFTYHGFGIDYDFDQENMPFEITCNQDGWRLPKALAERMRNEINTSITEILQLYQLKEMSVSNYQGNFSIGIKFSYSLIPSL